MSRAVVMVWLKLCFTHHQAGTNCLLCGEYRIMFFTVVLSWSCRDVEIVWVCRQCCRPSYHVTVARFCQRSRDLDHSALGRRSARDPELPFHLALQCAMSRCWVVSRVWPRGQTVFFLPPFSVLTVHNTKSRCCRRRHLAMKVLTA